MKENTTIVECTIVFQMLEDIMYGKGCGIDKDHVTWTLMHLDKNSPKGNYIYEENQECMSMWCVGAGRMPHAK